MEVRINTDTMLIFKPCDWLLFFKLTDSFVNCFAVDLRFFFNIIQTVFRILNEPVILLERLWPDIDWVLNVLIRVAVSWVVWLLTRFQCKRPGPVNLTAVVTHAISAYLYTTVAA